MKNIFKNVLCISLSFLFVFSLFLISLPAFAESSENTLLGDANEDGKVNNKDLVMIQRFINSWGNEINETAADYNEDGKINNKDLVMIQRFINGWFDTPEEPEGGESGGNGPVELPEDNFKD